MARLEERMQERCKKSALVCSYYEKEYKYNEKTKELELINEKGINIFEKIQSNKDCALNVVLDKFLNTGILPPAGVGSNSNLMKDKIDIALEKSQFFAKVREKYNLPDSYTEDEVMNFLEKAQDVSKQKIKDLEEAEKLKNVKKENKDEVNDEGEGKDNEKV